MPLGGGAFLNISFSIEVEWDSTVEIDRAIIKYSTSILKEPSAKHRFIRSTPFFFKGFYVCHGFYDDFVESKPPPQVVSNIDTTPPVVSNIHTMSPRHRTPSTDEIFHDQSAVLIFSPTISCSSFPRKSQGKKVLLWVTPRNVMSLVSLHLI